MYHPSRNVIVAQILIIFVLPVFLLYFNILPISFRMVLLAVSALFIYGIIRKEEWTHEEMGLRSDNFKRGIPFYFVFTLIGVAMLLFLANKLGMPDIDTRNYVIRSWIFFIPISFFQEFAFRSFLIPRLKMLYSNKYLIVFLNAVFFTLIHVIYPNLGIGLPIAFVSGVFFAWLYLKYPNLLLVSISHSILNILAVLLGFFAIVK